MKQADALAALADPCHTLESLSCACAALGRCSPNITDHFSVSFTLRDSMCEVARRCSSCVLAVGGVLPLVQLLSHAQEEVRCAACRALLQLCRCVGLGLGGGAAAHAAADTVTMTWTGRCLGRALRGNNFPGTLYPFR